MDPNNLSHWFPILQRTGVKVPRTEIVHTVCELWKLNEGMQPDGLAGFIGALEWSAMQLGFPVFMRTGHTSGKHDWRNTCYVETTADIASHVHGLIDFSEMVDFMGLPYQTWVLREFLPLRTAFKSFRGFPVNCERRYFIGGGEVLCHHPYWPERAVEQGNPDNPQWRELLAELNAESPGEVEQLTAMSRKVSAAFEGQWSLDWAQAANGDWYAIDMAQAHRSFHWDGCPVVFGKGGAS